MVTTAFSLRFMAAFALMCSLSLAPSRADATVMVRLSLDAQVAQSDLVVLVTAGASTTRWNEDATRPITLTRLVVREYLRGSGPQDLTLRQFGGTLDGETTMVPGDGHLRPGADFVLLLRRGNGVVYLTAMAQSVYAVLPTQQGSPPRVTRDLHDIAFAVPDSRGALVVTEAPDEPPVPLAQLVESIAAIVRRLPR